MKRLFFTLLSLIVLSCTSYREGSSVHETIKNKHSEKLPTYIEKISEQQMRETLKVISSDEMEGRDTGSEGIQRAAKYIVSQYEKSGISYPPIAQGWFQTVPRSFMENRYGDCNNIWAFIEGGEKKEEIIVVSAHYDHIGRTKTKIFNGADDNGTGVVAVMEIARIFNLAKKEGYTPKRSILFLLVTGEERGLYGSDYYSQNPLYELKQTVANLNIDMIGRVDELHTDNNYIYVIGSDRLSTDLHNINEDINRKYINLTFDYKYNDRKDPWQIYYRSDHYNFAKHGIPSVFFFNGIHPDYHQDTDTFEKIDFEALTKRTRLIFALAWELANREERIKVDRDGK